MSYKRSRETLVLDLFNNCNIFPIDSDDGLYETDDLYIRVLFDDEIVQLVNKENFDRWSNSIDYEYNGIPYDEEDVTQMLEETKQAIEEKKNR